MLHSSLPSPVELAFSEAGSGHLLIFLHGFMGSARNWQSFAKKFAASNHVVWADMRNHGASPWSNEMNYPAMAADVIRLIDRFGADRASLVGHSMGGKAAMMTSLLCGERINRLVVADIAPVAYDHGFENIFSAMRSLDLASLRKRSDADQGLAARIDDPGLRAFILQNLDTSHETLKWRCNLDVFEASMSDITGWDLPKYGRPYQGPTLFLHGANSDYVGPSSKPIIRELFTDHSFTSLPGAGHWLHADAPGPVLEALKGFLIP